MRLFVFNQSLATYCSLRRFVSENDHQNSSTTSDSSTTPSNLTSKSRTSSVQSLNSASKIFRREPIYNRSCGKYQTRSRRSRNQRSLTATGEQLFPEHYPPLGDSFSSTKSSEYRRSYWRRMSSSLDELDIKSKLSQSSDSFCNGTPECATNGLTNSDSKDCKDSILVHFIPHNSNDTQDNGSVQFEKVAVRDSLTVDRVLENVLESRGLTAQDVEVFLEGSQTPLPIFQSPSFCLGGRKLFVKAKLPCKMSGPVRTQSQQEPGRKTSIQSGSNVRKNSFMLNRSSKQKQLQLLQANNSNTTTTINSGQSSQASTPGEDIENIEGSKRTKSSLSRKSIFFGVKDRSMLNRLQLYCESSELPSTSSQYQACMNTLEIECSWKKLVLESETLSSRESDQQEAIWELIHTEEKYIRLLSLLTNIKGYLIALQKDGFLTDIEPTLLLRNIENVFNANLHFWIKGIYPVLLEARNNGRPLNVQGLSCAFSAMDQWFQPYIHFCIDHIQMLYYIEKKKKDSENFRDFVDFIQSLEALNRLHLKDLLAVPMQRLTKYPLLLKAILKKTDCSLTQSALKTMIEAAEETASRVNVEMSNKQQQDILVELNRTIEDFTPLDGFNDEVDKFVRNHLATFDITDSMPHCAIKIPRRLMMKGDLKMKDSLGFKGEVTCYLLTDMFLVCKSCRRGDKVRIIRPPYHIERVALKELEAGFGFGLINLNDFDVPTAAFSFHTSTREDSLRWLDQFQLARKDFHECRKAQTPTWRRVPSGNSYDWNSTSGSIHGSLIKREQQNARRVSVGCVDHQRSMSLCAMQAQQTQENQSNIERTQNDHTQVVHRKSSSMDSTALVAAQPQPSVASYSSMENILTSPKLHRLQTPSSNYLHLSGYEISHTGRKSLPNIICPEEITPCKTDSIEQLHNLGRPRSNSAEVLSKLLPQIRHPFRISSRSPSPTPSIDKSTPGSTLNPTLSAQLSNTTDSDDADTVVADTDLNINDEHIRIPSPVIPKIRDDYDLSGEFSVGFGLDKKADCLEPCRNANTNNGHGRRYERRYYTADAIDAFKPKQPPAGILKRFSWNISGAMANARPSSKKGNSVAARANEWRKGSTAMSSDSFCSSSGVSSSSSQLCVSEETEEDTMTLPLDDSCVHISRVSIDSNCPLAHEEDTVLASHAHFSDHHNDVRAPIRCPVVSVQVPSEDWDILSDAEHTDTNHPSRQQLLRLILEGGLETSDV